MTETLKKAAIGINRMAVILWCVMAEVTIVWLALEQNITDVEGVVKIALPEYIIITAMTLVAALGGVDRWKQPKES